jgi:AmmeMemoRadiSam system protein A
MTLTLTQQRTLIALARDAVIARVSGQLPPDAGDLDMLEAPGVFVTVRVGGQLRGCIGKLESERGLVSDVIECAGDAASRDSRFAPVSPAELAGLSLELSVLGPFEPCDPTDPQAIVLGVHGLLVERGGHRGLLLPQVAIEWQWTAQTFLCQACVKAGLSPDAWRRQARVYRFTAQVFGDAAT